MSEKCPEANATGNRDMTENADGRRITVHGMQKGRKRLSGSWKQNYKKPPNGQAYAGFAN